MKPPRIPWLKTNLGWKVLSVAIATAVWLMVAGEPDVATSIAAPLQLLNVPQNLAIASNPPAQVRLNVRGPSGRLTPDTLARVTAMLDLNGAKAGDRLFPIDATNVTLPRGVTIVRAVPGEVDVRLEQLVRREIPVRLRVALSPPSPWEIDVTEITPATMQASGPESNMRALGSALTEPIDLSQPRDEMTFDVHALLEDPSVRIEGSSRVTVKVKLRRKD